MIAPGEALQTVWVLVAALLVFFMGAGFAMVETGFCRAKNAVHVLAKNLVVFALASIAFWTVGFALMFGGRGGFAGTRGFLMSPSSGAFPGLEGGGVALPAWFFYQLACCGVAGAVVSGAMAERLRLAAFIVFSLVMCGVIYPLCGHWVWGGGFLAQLGFRDFAGGAVVHTVGGWAALAGVLSLGPRIGKYRKDGTVSPMPGHNMGLVTLGGFILWFGWFGLCAGRASVADPGAIAYVVVNTNLAAAGGTVSALAAAWVLVGKPDLGMTVNGTLGGLVAITASCAYVSAGAALVIGLVAGLLVVVGILGLDRLHLDDPVGTLAVHLVNGVFGTLALGLLASPDPPVRGGAPGPGLLYGGGEQIVAQLAGLAIVSLFAFLASLAVWQVIRVTIGLRVGPAEELQGLDVSEMGMEAYPHDSASAALR